MCRWQKTTLSNFYLPHHASTHLMIHDEHLGFLHAGPTLLAASLSRRKYHIIGGRKAFISVAGKCFTHRRYTSRPKPQLSLVWDVLSLDVAFCHSYGAVMVPCNFTGAARELKKLYQFLGQTSHKVMSRITSAIKKLYMWKFIPYGKTHPIWAESGKQLLAKCVKIHLKCVLCDVKLTYEEFSTLLYQIKACLNL